MGGRTGQEDPQSLAGPELRHELAPRPTARRIEELQQSLQKKDANLRAMEERYQRYVDKVSTWGHSPSGQMPPCLCLLRSSQQAGSPPPFQVMQTLEPKQAPPAGPSPELHSLRTQLRERTARIRNLEVRFTA